LIVRQAFAYGGKIQYSRQPPPIPRQSAARMLIASREMRLGERVRGTLVAEEIACVA